MKKVITVLCSILLIALLSGCSLFDDGNRNDGSTTKAGSGTSEKSSATESTAGTTSAVVENLKAEAYFPIKPNVHYVYEGSGNEYAPYDVYIDYTAEGKVQQRVGSGGTVVARVIEVKEGKVTRVFSRGETYFRENFLAKTDGNPEILLMEPLVKGTTWTLADSRVRTITGTAMDVSTPSGNYKAIEVTTTGKDSKTVDYYVNGIGLVKSVFNPGASEITSTLSKIEENVPLVQRISFFYPNINDNKIYFKDKDIAFNTNDITRSKLESAYKEPAGNGTGAVLTPNTKINSLYLNQDGMVYIDLSGAFLKEMKAGSGYEGMMLKSIANTFGKYYNVERVILTIDNKLYESGHFVFKKGEYLKVEPEGAVEIK